MIAPFPYFGGKRTIAEGVWARLGSPKQYLDFLASKAPSEMTGRGDYAD